MRFEFEAELWRVAGPGDWCFVTLPRETSQAIRRLAPGSSPAFGSRRVTAWIGDTEWKSSIFPDARSESFLLPIKASVRKATGVGPGDQVALIIELDL